MHIPLGWRNRVGALGLAAALGNSSTPGYNEEVLMSMAARLWRHLPELMVLALAVWVQWKFASRLAECRFAVNRPRLRRALRIVGILLVAWVGFGVIGNFPALYRRLPSSTFIYWFRGAALAWCLSTIAAYIILVFARRIPRFSEDRRGFMRAAGAVAVAAPFAAMGFGILVQRDDFRIKEIKVPVPNLPKDLDGLRIVQLSDIHLSPFLSEKEFARAVDMANELKGHLALITGDLITSRGDPLETCIRQVARVRADAGILGCLGNHEIYAQAQDHATSYGARFGIQFLRSKTRQLRFGNSTLNVAGVDYQRLGRPYLPGAEKMLVPGATNILLSHNPDVFDVAAGQGWDVTISGHTHGGQVTVEILNQNLSAARFFTPYVYGLYQKDGRAVWVTRGIGTVGVPARIGAPPEVALIRLCATSS